jgi:hypothetical protein
MPAIRRIFKRWRTALLLGCLLVGCPSVVATSEEGSERKTFGNKVGNEQTSNRDHHERKPLKYGQALVTHGEMYGKTDKKSHAASSNDLITNSKNSIKGKEYNVEYHKESYFALVTHGFQSDKGEPETKSYKQATRVLGTHDKGGSKDGKKKGDVSKGGKKKGEVRKGGKKKEEVSKGGKGKSRTTKSKGKGRDTAPKGKDTKTKGKGMLRKEETTG